MNFMKSDRASILVLNDGSTDYSLINSGSDDVLRLVPSANCSQVPYRQYLFPEKLPDNSFILYVPDFESPVYDPFPPNYILNYKFKNAVARKYNNFLYINRDGGSNPEQFYYDENGYVRNYHRTEEYLCINKTNDRYVNYAIVTSDYETYPRLQLNGFCIRYFTKEDTDGEFKSNVNETKIDLKDLKQNENPVETVFVGGIAKTIDTVKSGVSMTMLFNESNGYRRYSYIDDDGWIQMVPVDSITYDTQGYFKRGQILFKHPNKSGVFYLSDSVTNKQWYYLKNKDGDYQDQRWENAVSTVPFCRDGSIFNNYYIRRQSDSKAQPTWFIFDDQNRVYEMKSDGTFGDELTFVYSGGKVYLGFGGSKATFNTMYDKDIDGTLSNSGESGYES
ncbi:hypothetical protein DLAC_01021 [Tieghemostelium lacteum]|uniref:Uncharacterized protein n=1 Tax=Tieghemostelium lacteum TaxID=361077 RepID=A0A152A7J6_TIELA|nr:hypothetical protein DLAC_01021 [Tieghemostelium lacteum]|eukprot:KYR02202.1 hypothetical protein DLAC_01021 [Tieghemostelium lacteum]